MLFGLFLECYFRVAKCNPLFIASFVKTFFFVSESMLKSRHDLVDSSS